MADEQWVGVLGDSAFAASIAQGLLEAGLAPRVVPPSLSEHVPVLVDARGDADPTPLVAALNAGHHVVATDPKLVAAHGPALVDVGSLRGCECLMSSALYPGIPLAEVMATTLLRGPRHSVAVVDGGGDNAALDVMQRTASTLEDACRRVGAGETSAVSDAARIAALASVLMGRQVDPASVVARDLAAVEQSDFHHLEQFGYQARMVNTIAVTDGRMDVSCLPTLLPRDHPLAGVRPNRCRALITHPSEPPLAIEGAATDQDSVIRRVIADVTEISTRRTVVPPPRTVVDLAMGRDDQVAVAGYVRLLTLDPGAAETQIADLLNGRGIDLVLAAPRRVPGSAEVVILTGPTTVGKTDAAVRAMADLQAVTSIPTRLYLLADV